MSYNFNHSHHNASQQDQENNMNESNINSLLINTRQAEGKKNAGKQCASVLSSMCQSQIDQRASADARKRLNKGGVRPHKQTSPTELDAGKVFECKQLMNELTHPTTEGFETEHRERPNRKRGELQAAGKSATSVAMTAFSGIRSSEPLGNLTTDEATTPHGPGTGTGSFSQLKACK